MTHARTSQARSLVARPSQARPAALLLALALAGCATAAPPIVVAPDAIPALEAAVAANPASADTLTLLGAAYQAADRHEDAARTLERALATGDAEPVAQLYLGLANEALERWQPARDAYVAYLEGGTGDDDVRADVSRRIALVDRARTEQAARELLEREETLSALPPEPRSVAVFPFLVTSDDARFEPLQLALADMVTTDLSIPGVLTLIERAQIQALVREMALNLAGYAEPETGARVGRLMRAEHVVQGSVTLLPDEQVRLEMAIVDATTRERTGTTQDQTALEQIFDAEKTLVFGVLDALGVTLTPAEREQIEENRAANLIAFLAYGDGLMAMDRGDFVGAAAAFGAAAQADPGFGPAAAAQEQATDLQQAAQTSTQEVALDASRELPRGPVDGLDSRRNALNDIVDRTVPNPGSQYTGGGTGQDGATQGFGDDDTSQDPNDDVIGGDGVPTVPIDIPPIDNPTLP